MNLEDLGPAARSRYDTTGQDLARRDKSRPRAKSSGHSKDHRHSKPRSGHSDKGSSQRESLAAKLIARKERDKRYRKVVENPMLYLEE